MNGDLLAKLKASRKKNSFDDGSVSIGDLVRVGLKVSDVKGSERVQYFQGIVIRKSGSALSRNFTVRKIGVNGVGVEMIIPFNCGSLVSIEVVSKSKPRRAKLFYLRKRVGKAAMVV